MLAAIVVLVGTGPVQATGAGAPARADRQTVQSPPATPPPASTPARGRGARQNAPPGRVAVEGQRLRTVEDLFDAVEMNDAGNFLQLRDDQYGQFVPRLRRLQALRRQHIGQRRQLVDQLRRLVRQQPPAEDALLEAPAKRLDEFDRQAAAGLLAARAQLDEVLDVRQRALLRMFDEVMERKKLEIVTRVFQAAPAGPGRGGR
jgi:hypothetical protein